MITSFIFSALVSTQALAIQKWTFEDANYIRKFEAPLDGVVELSGPVSGSAKMFVVEANGKLVGKGTFEGRWKISADTRALGPGVHRIVVSFAHERERLRPMATGELAVFGKEALTLLGDGVKDGLPMVRIQLDKNFQSDQIEITVDERTTVVSGRDLQWQVPLSDKDPGNYTVTAKAKSKFGFTIEGSTTVSIGAQIELDGSAFKDIARDVNATEVLVPLGVKAREDTKVTAVLINGIHRFPIENAKAMIPISVLREGNRVMHVTALTESGVKLRGIPVECSVKSSPAFVKSLIAKEVKGFFIGGESLTLFDRTPGSFAPTEPAMVEFLAFADLLNRRYRTLEEDFDFLNNLETKAVFQDLVAVQNFCDSVRLGFPNVPPPPAEGLNASAIATVKRALENYAYNVDALKQLEQRLKPQKPLTTRPLCTTAWATRKAKTLGWLEEMAGAMARGASAPTWIELAQRMPPLGEGAKQLLEDAMGIPERLEEAKQFDRQFQEATARAAQKESETAEARQRIRELETRGALTDAQDAELKRLRGQVKASAQIIANYRAQAQRAKDAAASKRSAAFVIRQRVSLELVNRVNAT